MGIELPPELADVAQAAGVHWPQADEDKMRAAAQAWRDAGTRLDTLVTDSDNTARNTLTHMQGGAGESATKHWSTFVQADTGHLTATAKGCTDAADRLDHAAEQVGTAKTEIVRQLVALAGNTDAAHTAAASGHPTALASLDTLVKGTAANVATINHSLVKAVRPDGGVNLAATQLPAQATPGEHGPLTTLVDRATHGATQLVDHTTQTVTGPSHGHTGPGDATGQGHSLLGDPTKLLDNTTQGLTGQGHSGPGDSGGQGHTLLGDTTKLVDDTAQGLTGQGHGVVSDATGLVDDTAQGLTGQGHGHGLVSDTTGLVDNTTHGVVGDVTNLVDPGHQTLGDITAGDTGPIPIQDPDAPTPATGLPLPHHTSQVVSAAGLADAPGVTNLPGNAGPGAGAFPGAQPLASPQPGAPGGGLVGGGPVGGAPVGGPAGGAPVRGGLVGGPVAAPVAGSPTGGRGPVEGAPSRGGPSAPVGGSPAGGRGAPVGGAPIGGNPAPVRGGSPGVDPVGRGASGEGAQAGRGAAPVAGLGPAPVSSHLPPGHKTEREQLVAVLLVHMFPIGHMPVAASEPARQLPTPPPELDYAAGLRFGPDDHPDSSLVGTATPPEQLPDVAPLTAESEAVQQLLTDYDTLGDLHERDWDHRFLVRPAGPQGDVEYAWPPGELYPEGGTAPGEPEVLDAGTELDRFGSAAGRVFADVETPFPQRSLPPSHVDLEYRRYRVVAPIPVWRSVSAAWFAQPGGGVRYRTTRSAAELVALGHLEDVTQEETP